MTRRDDPQPAGSTMRSIVGPPHGDTGHLDHPSNRDAQGFDVDEPIPGRVARPPRHRRRLDDTATPRSLAVQKVLLNAGLDLVDEVGLAGVTVRALAARTFYSPSSIGYHTTPMERFVELLWEELARRFAADTLVRHESVDDRAVRVLGWVAENPNRATFFLRHTPLDARPLVAALRADQRHRETGDDDDQHVARYVARRLQAAIEFGLSRQHPVDAVRIVATSLRNEPWETSCSR